MLRCKMVLHMRFSALLVFALLLSAFAFAAEETAGSREEKAHEGIDLGTAGALFVYAAIASAVLLILVYLILGKAK